MINRAILGSSGKRAVFACLLLAVVCLTLAASFRYSTILNGIPDPEVERMDSGWFYEDGGSLVALAQLPCSLDLDSDTLYLIHDISDTVQHPGDVLAVQTRYQSIRVWADQTLIYEAAQGREHALSSMWHFIPEDQYSDASAIRIELQKYDQKAGWELFEILRDHPDAIGMYLLSEHLSTILVWLCCLLFTLLLAFIILFMTIRKIAGIPPVMALAAFVFLSGTWILLDSKVTTVAGGNYALTYFLSYCVFYLLPIPLLFYFQLMLELKNPFVRCLIWITAGNAGLWMLLHLLGIVSIQSTAISVHLIIVAFLAIFVWTALRKKGPRPQKRLVCTFWGISAIFAAALVSIILYHADLLPPTNSALLYAWGIFALILCMVMDTVAMFGRVWKEKQYIEIYRQLATQDSMTRLANRNAYELRLRELAAAPPGEIVFILFDIDRMKDINDTYGHHVGDQVISFTAQCIYEVFGSSGGCYRIGGDEFCVILTNFDGIPQKLQQFDDLIHSWNKSSFLMSVSYGWEKRYFEEGTPIAVKDIIDLKTASDRNLYKDKKAHT